MVDSSVFTHTAQASHILNHHAVRLDLLKLQSLQTLPTRNILKSSC